MWPSKKPYWVSSFSCSVSVLVLLLVSSLVAISIVVCTLGPEKSWIPLSSPWVWRDRFSSSFSLASNDQEQNRTSSFDLVGEADFMLGSSILNGSFEHTVLAKEKTLQSPYEEKSSIETSVNDSTSSINRYTRLERVEAILAKARSSIKEAARIRNMTSIHEDPDYVPQGPVYRNANAFHRSHLEMEQHFKIYVYEEGEHPIFHNGPCRSIYSTEGRFISEMEKGNIYVTKDPENALVYFLPFSIVMMVQYLYVPGALEFHAIGRTVADYIDIVAIKHPFWNRSLGSDHFMLSCHDWGPYTTTYVPHLFNNSIRVLCNANTSEGFNPSKDVSLPEINLKTGEITGLLGGLSPSKRSVLAFFAGGLHGHIRYLLLEQWKNKDEDVLVYDNLPAGMSYDTMLKKSRYEVASPRVVEAIYAECIPVLISDGYVPPFRDVLNWKAFAIVLPVKDIPNLKNILMGISQTQYLRMHRRVKLVQKHFVVNEPPKRFDLFHMIIHSIWLRRLNIHIRD